MIRHSFPREPSLTSRYLPISWVHPYTRGLLLFLAAFLWGCTGGSSSKSPSTPSSLEPPANATALRADRVVVDSGESITLSWNASNATSCQASGGWSGNRPARGAETVGPLTQQTTYSLDCSGGPDNSLQMVTVKVNGPISLSWVAPTTNEDGSELTDLAGYRIYLGEYSGEYETVTEITDPRATSTTIDHPSGEYHVAVTAFDSEDHESAYSNEVLRTVR